MKSFVLVLSLVVGSWMVSPTPVAQASWLGDLWSSWSQSFKTERADKYERYKKYKKHGNAVPELDPSAAGGAMILLLGGVAYIASRRREEDLV